MWVTRNQAYRAAGAAIANIEAQEERTENSRKRERAGKGNSTLAIYNTMIAPFSSNFALVTFIKIENLLFLFLQHINYINYLPHEVFKQFIYRVTLLNCLHVNDFRKPLSLKP